MRCGAQTKNGQQCTRRALADATVCASHAGRCGARRGNLNALKHGLYSRRLSAEEQDEYAAAYAADGLEQEIAVTRLLILRAIRNPDVDPSSAAKLLATLCAELKTQRSLDGRAGDSIADALGTILEEVSAELGLDER